MLAKDGCRSCVLKGQANASYYPKPELRSSGDIDIWVSPVDSVGLDEDRKKVAEYVIEHEDDYVRMQYHYIDYHVFKDVEVHFCPIVLFNSRENDVLRHGRLLMKEWEKWSERNKETIRTEGSKSK